MKGAMGIGYYLDPLDPKRLSFVICLGLALHHFQKKTLAVKYLASHKWMNPHDDKAHRSTFRRLMQGPLKKWTEHLF